MNKKRIISLLGAILIIGLLVAFLSMPAITVILRKHLGAWLVVLLYVFTAIMLLCYAITCDEY